MNLAGSCEFPITEHFWNLTYREFIAYHDGRQITAWDHTAQMLVNLNYIQCIVVNAVSKSKIRPRTFEEFHPYREHRSHGTRINQSNFKMLQKIGDSLSRE